MKFSVICCLGFLASCKREKSDLDFGIVKLRKGVEATLPISFAINQQRSPWRLRFRCAEADSGKLTPTDKLVIYLHNNDSNPLIFTLNPDSRPLTIQPFSKAKIFDGSLEHLISLDRSMDEKMAFESSRERGINAKLQFIPELSTQTLHVGVSTFFFREGM
jgi:hypothetical protein